MLNIKRKIILINFNILPLRNNKVVLGMQWLQKYNFRID